MSSSFGYAAMLTSMSGAVLFWYLSFLWRTWSPVTGLCVLGNWKKNRKWSIINHLRFAAERQGFEPRVHRCTPVFKTGAIDHSAISPYVCPSFYDGAKLTLFVHSCKNADTHCAKNVIEKPHPSTFCCYFASPISIIPNCKHYPCSSP